MKKRILLVLLPVLLVLGCITVKEPLVKEPLVDFGDRPRRQPTAKASPESELGQCQEQLAYWQNKYDQLKAKSKRDKHKLEQKIDQREDKIEILEDKIENLEDRIDDLKDR